MTRIGLLLVAIVWMGSVAWADVPSNAFTYQGQLKETDAPANASYDLAFILSNVQGGAGIVPAMYKDDLPIADGLFTVELDFVE